MLKITHIQLLLLFASFLAALLAYNFIDQGNIRATIAMIFVIVVSLATASWLEGKQQN